MGPPPVQYGQAVQTEQERLLCKGKLVMDLGKCPYVGCKLVAVRTWTTDIMDSGLGT